MNIHLDQQDVRQRRFASGHPLNCLSVSRDHEHSLLSLTHDMIYINYLLILS